MNGSAFSADISGSKGTAGPAVNDAAESASGALHSSPVGDVAPREEGRNGKNAEPIGDLSTAYDEPRSNFHAACPLDCAWGPQ